MSAVLSFFTINRTGESCCGGSGEVPYSYECSMILRAAATVATHALRSVLPALGQNRLESLSAGFEFRGGA